MFSEYLERWKLTPDGEPIATPTSRLLPVRWRGSAAMLKIAVSQEERLGGLLMVWWIGRALGGGWLKTGHKVTMAVREPASSKAIELKKQGFGVAAAKHEAAKRPSRRRQAI